MPSWKKKALSFVIDCSKPVEDKIMDISSFEKFLLDRIKVEGKTGTERMMTVNAKRGGGCSVCGVVRCDGVAVEPCALSLLCCRQRDVDGLPSRQVRSVPACACANMCGCIVL